VILLKIIGGYLVFRDCSDIAITKVGKKPKKQATQSKNTTKSSPSDATKETVTESIEGSTEKSITNEKDPNTKSSQSANSKSTTVKSESEAKNADKVTTISSDSNDIGSTVHDKTSPA
jgi:hypothetical protein